MTKSFDVVVIGGGPAGSAAAGNIAKLGHSVALLEKAHHPRYQVGESLIPHFWRYADAFDVSPKIQADAFVQKAGGTMYWSNQFRQFSFLEFGFDRPALHVERDRFDEILFRHAGTLGVETYEDTLVTDFETSDKGCRVVAVDKKQERELDIRCKLIIDASGQGGLIAKRDKLREMDGGFRFQAIWGYFKGSKFVSMGGKVYPESECRNVKPTTFVASMGNGGWGWNIMLRNETSVGLLVPVDLIKSEKADLEGFFLSTCRSVPYFASLLDEAEYIPGSLHMHRDYSYRTTQFCGPGYFLVGDAGAFSDPIFSHGVHFALFSGFHASYAVAKYFTGEHEKARKAYNRRTSQYYEFSRSLALPNYDPSEAVSDRVKNLLQLVSQTELDLMYAASAMTDRSENFLRMARAAGLQGEARGVSILPALVHHDGRELSRGVAA